MIKTNLGNSKKTWVLNSNGVAGFLNIANNHTYSYEKEKGKWKYKTTSFENI